MPPPNFPTFVPKRPGQLPPRRVPKARRTPPRAPIYVPPAALAPKAERRAAAKAPPRYTYHPPAPKPPAPTRRQVQQSHEQAQAYRAQGRAVRRAAATQKVLGPGQAVKVPHGKSLTPQRLAAAKTLANARAQETAYASLGAAVKHVAADQRTKAAAKAGEKTVKVGGFSVPKVLMEKDPKVLKVAGFHGPGMADALMEAPVKALVHAPKDAAELAVTMPTSLAHQVVEGYGVGKSLATGHPGKAWEQTKHIGSELAAPYKQALIDPKTGRLSAKTALHFATDHPVTSYLMFAPGLKVPGHVVGRGARLAGRSTLRKTSATLPGTAFTVAKRGNRNVLAEPTKRFLREPITTLRRRHPPEPPPKATQRELRAHVDEAFDFNRHLEHHTVKAHRAAAKTATHGQPKHVREAAIAEAEQVGREQARIDSAARVARRFGANAEPAVSIHHVDALKALRDQAEQHVRETADAHQAARDTHAQALDAAKRARTKRKRTSKLDTLRGQRAVAAADLNRAQRAHQAARVALAEAKGEAKVSQTQTKGSPLLSDLHGQRRAVAKTVPADEVKAAQRRVSRADQTLNSIERQLRDAEERGAHLAGISVGRAKGGKLTGAASKAVGDQVEKIGVLHDALHDAHIEAQASRDHLASMARGHQGQVREAARAIDTQIRGERRRIAGVAPGQHQSLLDAIAAHGEGPARVRAARDRVRAVDQQIAEENRRIAGVPPAEADALRSAIHGREDAAAAERAARDTHGQAYRAHVDSVAAHRHTALVNPAAEGRLWDDPREAKRVAYRLNQQGPGGGPMRIPVGDLPYVPKSMQRQVHVHEPDPNGPASIARSFEVTRGAGETPVQYKVQKVGDQWAVLPKDVKQRLYGGGARGSTLSHASVGTGRATGAIVMRRSRQGLTRSTLPFSFKWLGGQAGEALVRAVTTGAGAIDWARARAVAKRMNELHPATDHHPGAGDAWLMRIGGGQFDPLGAIAEQVKGGQTLEEAFHGTPAHTLAAMGTRAGQTIVPRLGAKGVRAWTTAIMSGVNHVIERNTKIAMAGHDIRHGPLMEDKAIGVMGKAIDQAAHGLMHTPEQIESVRNVNNAYGKYSGHSPEMRSALAHWTPFLPWYLNVARYLFRTLPHDHPYRTAMLADMNQADLEWRKQHRLSFYGKKRVPDFLMGSYPIGKDRYIRVAHYTPWGVGADVLGSAASLVLPQFEGSILNALGVNYLGKPLEKQTSHGKQPFGKGEDFIKAAASFAETQVPGFGLAERLTGLGPKYIDKRANVPKTLGERAKSEVPFMPTRPSHKPKRKRSGLGGGSLSGGGLSGGLGGGL
jgi:hypothetical protein